MNAPTQIQTSTSKRLRAELASMHDSVEKYPLAQRIMAHDITRREYSTLLDLQYQLHDAVENALRSVQLPPTLLNSAMIRTPALAKDLSYFNHKPGTSTNPGHDEWAESLHSEFQRDSFHSLGCLYVLEGSRMGSLVLVKKLGFALDLELELGCGLDYHLQDAPGIPQRFAHWKHTLDELQVSQEQLQGMIRVARSTMERAGLAFLYAEEKQRV